MNTTYFLNCAAGNIFNTKTSPALPKTYYIGLSTSAPAINGTGVNEPSTDAGYARVKLSSLGEPVDGVVTNSQAINFELGHDYPFRYLRFRHCWRGQSPDVWYALYTA